MADNLTGNDLDNTFEAPVTQNMTGSGALANTFDTGDVLQGGSGRNVLEAELISVATEEELDLTPPISATTSNIQEVYLRAQAPAGGVVGALAGFANTIDAEDMSGVEQWWSTNSRSAITIEDIRTLPVSTAFGMQLTDPGVSYTAYFNALFLEGEQNVDSSITILIQEVTNGQDPADTELENISVRELNFGFDGVDYSLASDEMAAADTWADLETAIADALVAEGLETLSVTLVGNGVYVIEDSEGGAFTVEDGEALIFGAAADIDVRNRVEVGLLVD
jgi:hypothetical protein